MAVMPMSLVCAVFITSTYMYAVVSGLKLQLKNDVGMTQDLRDLKAAISTLQKEMYDVRADNSRLKRHVRDVMTETKQLAMANIKLSNSMKDSRSSAGSTYVRWGKSSCSNNTQTVYSGYMAGQDSGTKSSGANPLCLPRDPTWARYNDENQSSYRGYIAGTEYKDIDNLLGRNTAQQNAPCARCSTPRSLSVMFPARTTCYPDWKLEYTGYLMSGHNGLGSPTEYICVDGNPEFVMNGGANTDGHLIYPVEVLCGTLPCPPYVNHRELACSVCSK